MTTDTYKGWLIHKRWVGETSAQLTLFTQSHGIVSCRYTGCRNKKKQAALIPFAPLWLTINTKGNWLYVQSLELLDPPVSLTGISLFSAFYVNELIHHICRELEPQEDIFNAYVEALKALSESTEKSHVESALRQFEWIFLKESGYEIPLELDITGEPVHPQKQYQYLVGEGLCSVPSGIPGHHFIELSQHRRLSEEGLRYMKRVMRIAINHLLDGKILKTRALFHGQIQRQTMSSNMND